MVIGNPIFYELNTSLESFYIPRVKRMRVMYYKYVKLNKYINYIYIFWTSLDSTKHSLTRLLKG